MTRATSWWTTAAVDLVVRVLPRERRERYRQELRSELHGMTRWRQFAHTAGFLSRTWALRAALADSLLLNGDQDMTPSINWFRRLLCRLNIHHDYVRVHGEDNTPYDTCRRCGKDLYLPPGPGGGAVFGGAASF
jgi:hypothetical protein